MAGIKNVIELEDLVIKIFKGIEKSKADGKWEIGDAVNFLDVAFVVKPALEEIGEIPSEIMDLDEKELEVVIAKAAEAFPSLPAKALAVAKGVVKVLMGGVEIYKALKA